MLKYLRKIYIIERVVSFLETMGLLGTANMVGLVMLSVIWAIWGWLESHLPYWGIALVLMGSFGICAFAFNQTIKLYREITAKKIDTQKLSASLIVLSEEMLRMVIDIARQKNPLPVSTANEEPAYAAWESARQESQRVERLLVEKFGARLMTSLLVLGRIGVDVPFHLSHLSSHNIMGLASYLGAVGHLIRDGNLSVAQTLGDDEQWSVSRTITTTV